MAGRKDIISVQLATKQNRRSTAKGVDPAEAVKRHSTVDTRKIFSADSALKDEEL